MSEHASKRKVVKSKSQKSKSQKSEGAKVAQAVEVLYFDCVQKEKVVATFKGESRWWYGTRMFAIYHPSFAGGMRWVAKVGRILGPSHDFSEEELRSQAEVEFKVIRQMFPADKSLDYFN